MPLRSPAFLRLLAAQTLATFADGLWRVTLLTLVLQAGGAAADLTAVMLAGVLPAMLLSAVGGTWADRFCAAWLVQATQLSRAALLLGLLAWLTLPEAGGLLPLLGVNVLLSALSALANPAYNTLLPRVLPPERLAQGNAAFATGDSLAFAAAPALAGAWLLVGGPEGLLLLGGGLLLVMVALLHRIPALEGSPAGTGVQADPSGPAPLAEGTGTLAGMREAWHWVAAEPGARALLLCFAVTNLVTPAGMVALPLYAQTLAHPAAYGWLLSAMGAGTLLASLLIMRWPLTRLGWVTGLAAVAAGLLSHIGLGLTATLPLALVLVLLGDGLFTLPNILFPTWLQQRVPASLLGRVFGLIGAMSYALVPLGYLLAPGLLAQFSPAHTLMLLGAGLVVVGLSALAVPSFRGLKV
ncbi:MAG: MFS transporter [Deinococcus sp.]|nr:MFS transporter [Deinococcus sp.]